MSRLPALVGLVVVLALGALAYGLGTRPTTAEPTAPSRPATAPAAPAASNGAGTEAPIERADPTPAERQPAIPPAPAGAPSTPQGLRGLVVDAARRPLADLHVHLVEAAANDPLRLPMMHQQQHFMAPLASVRTAADGAFAIGLPVAEDKLYELYIVSPAHATVQRGAFRLVPGEWHDLGVFTMHAGTTVRGRVTVAGRPDIPVPQAVVMVEASTAFADAALRALPEQQGALVAQVDATGHYELHHAPVHGVVRISALAPGFARLTRNDIELSADAPVTVDFGLQPGESYGGSVSDDEGAAVPNARIELWPHRPGEGPVIGFSDDRGRFVVHGLVAGEYRLRLSAPGFVPHEEAGVTAGRADAAITLLPRARVEVRVRTPSGNVVRQFRLAIRRSFGNAGAPGAGSTLSIAALIDVPDQNVRLDGLSDTAIVGGLPPGTFVCEVEAPGFAKTYSRPFECTQQHLSRRGAPIAVEVDLTPGGTIHGSVFAENGEPLAGATVSTAHAGGSPDSPLARLLGGAVPKSITTARVTTAANGSFTLGQLALGDYQLIVEHPEACRTIVPGVVVAAAGEQRLPAIRLLRGAVVRGRALVGGRITGQVRVVLSTPPQTPASDSILVEATTDAEGRYQLPRRVPPGTYEVRAAAIGTTDPEAQVIHQLLQLQRSTTTLTVPSGEDAVACDFDLPSAN
jgi:hypothetical protein